MTQRGRLDRLRRGNVPGLDEEGGVWRAVVLGWRLDRVVVSASDFRERSSGHWSGRG